MTFVALPVHTITATAGVNGAVSPSGATAVYETYNQTFTITPNAGYAIGSLDVDGVPVTAATTYTFTNVMADHTISATFVQTTSGTSHSGSGGGHKAKTTNVHAASSSAEIVDEERSFDLENILKILGVQVSGIPSGINSDSVGTASTTLSTTSPDIFGTIEGDSEDIEGQNEANILSAIQHIPGLKEVLIMVLILSLIGGFFLRRYRM